jgi:hypothetical protein
MVQADASVEVDLFHHNSLGVKDASQRAQAAYDPFPAYEKECSLSRPAEYGGCSGFSELSPPGFVPRAEQVRVWALHYQTNGILPYTQGTLLLEMLR